MIKKLLNITLCGTLALGFASCSDDDTENVPVPDTKNETFQTIAEQYLDNTVIVTYKNLADNAEKLVTQLKAIQSNKTDANVNAACVTFLEARAWWEKSEAFLFGPANDFGIDPHIDSWPLDRDGLVSEMNHTAHIEAMAAEDGDEWAGSHLGQELLGFHGIEYIIFADGSAKSASAIPDNELIYAIAVAGDLRNKCYQLQLSWAGENGVATNRLEKVADVLEWPYTVNSGSFSYKENMLNAGQAGSTYRSYTDAMQAIVDGCMSIADEVGLQKIGKPHTGEDINYIESPYSHMSITDFYDNIVSIENVYMGGIEGQRNEAKSLHAYMKSANADLDSRCISAISNAQAKIKAMKAPFVKYYTDPSASDAMQACNDLVEVLTEVKVALAK